MFDIVNGFEITLTKINCQAILDLAIFKISGRHKRGGDRTLVKF